MGRVTTNKIFGKLTVSDFPDWNKYLQKEGAAIKPIKVYRIENPNTMHGMWYKLDGTYCPFIKTLTEGISKDLPMDFDEKYSKDGFAWFSAGKSIENMRQWFSKRDAQELRDAGYILYEFEVSQYEIWEMQAVFTREGVVAQREIPINDIWGID